MKNIGTKAAWILGIAVVAAGGFYGWTLVRQPSLPEGFAVSNGRVEAVEIDVAAKTAGRIEELLVNDGDFVTTGQVLAQMETAVLEAQLREAQAGLKQAEIGIETATSLVTQREAEREAALAGIAQREAELDAATKQLSRTEELAAKGTATLQRLDNDRAQFESAKAALNAAKATFAGTEAAIGHAKAQVVAAHSQVEASHATIDRIKTNLADTTLKAPRDGRVQYRVAQPGEVVAAGGTVVNLVDLSDVYMNFFLATAEAGRVAIGAEVRIVLDAAPEYAIPAQVTYVADVAQFTPKSVETEDERQKLTFRVKAKVPSDLLKKYMRLVKTGLPGLAYVRLDPQAKWPQELTVRLPQ